MFSPRQINVFCLHSSQKICTKSTYCGVLYTFIKWWCFMFYLHLSQKINVIKINLLNGGVL